MKLKPFYKRVWKRARIEKLFGGYAVWIYDWVATLICYLIVLPVSNWYRTVATFVRRCNPRWGSSAWRSIT